MPKRTNLLQGDIVRLPLQDGTEAIVDADDWEAVRDVTWHVYRPNKSRDYEVVRTRLAPLARTIMERAVGPRPSGHVIDHIDGDVRNNRRSNLRYITQAGNARNRRGWGASSQYRGVSRLRGRWTVRISKEVATEAEAALLYNQLAILLYGDEARLNEVPEGGDNA